MAQLASINLCHEVVIITQTILKSKLMTFLMYSKACPSSRNQFQQNDCNLQGCLLQKIVSIVTTWNKSSVVGNKIDFRIYAEYTKKNSLSLC